MKSNITEWKETKEVENNQSNEDIFPRFEFVDFHPGDKISSIWEVFTINRSGVN